MNDFNDAMLVILGKCNDVDARSVGFIRGFSMQVQDDRGILAGGLKFISIFGRQAIMALIPMRAALVFMVNVMKKRIHFFLRYWHNMIE